MDIRQLILVCGFIFLGASARAASFDCTKSITRTEKIICQSGDLSDLDSKLSQLYEKAYRDSDSAAKENLLVRQRSWMRYVRPACGTEECIKMAYEDRIDQLEDIANHRLSNNRTRSATVLEFSGLEFGQVLSDSAARKVFSHLDCHSKYVKAEAKLMSSIEHQAVTWCEGKTRFEGQNMDAVVELHGNRRLAGIELCYDTPYPEEGVNSTSVSKMEDRLIALHGMPDVLRTESRHQPIQYDPKDLLEDSNPLDGGSDQWIFANDASINLGSCLGHQKEPGGHIFEAEEVSFTSLRRLASITLPAHHAIPIILTKIAGQISQGPLWKSDELMTVEMYAGGKRTCKVGQPIPLSRIDSRGTRYESTITCTDFVEIGYSPAVPADTTTIRVVKNSNVLAVGYIPKALAVARLESR